MHDAVRRFYRDFTATSEIEGVVNHMYLDTLGLVTVGIGTLIEDQRGGITSEALTFAFVFRDDPGRRATDQDIRDDFRAVKSRGPGFQHGAYQSVTRLILGDAEMDRLVSRKLDSIEANARLIPELSGMDTWPADAQLGLFSMAYALGAAFAPKYPSFRAACAARDFRRAARESHIKESNNPNIRARNWANELMFVFAARVLEQGRPLDQLVFPNILTSGGKLIDMGLAPTHAVWPTLKANATGRQVEVLQELLGLVPTGVFDVATRAAVMLFQSTATDRNGQPLTPDGIVGLQTWRALVVR